MEQKRYSSVSLWAGRMIAKIFQGWDFSIRIQADTFAGKAAWFLTLFLVPLRHPLV
jgi:hypothetical protein